MNHREVAQQLMDKIMDAVSEALNENPSVSSKELAGVIFGCGVGALKAEGVSKPDILIETEKCFDRTGLFGRGGVS